MEMWRKCGEAASASALYSVYSDLYSEAVVSSVVSAVALVEVGRFREAVEYVRKAAKALCETAKEVFEHVKVTAQRLVELFIEAVTRVLAWLNEHKAYLFLMAAAARAVALNVALNLWGLVELDKLAYAASAPFVAGLADAGGKAAERFRAVAERYEKWKVDENVINEIINAPLRGERPYEAFQNLAKSRKDLPLPLAKLKKALLRVGNGAERDAAVVVTLVLYKALVNNARAYRVWAGWYDWARGLVQKQEFAVTASEIKKLREAQRRLEEAAEEVRRELNNALTMYAERNRDLYEKLRPYLEVDVEKAEELAEARSKELSKYSDASMGTKAYAALLSVARGGIYGHVAMLLAGKGALADLVLSAPATAYNRTHSRRRAAGLEDRAASALLQLLSGGSEENLKFKRVNKVGEKGRVEKGGRMGFGVFRTYGGVETFVGELWIVKTTAYFTLSEEERNRFVEEAKRMALNLSGIKKIRHALEWLATDVSFTGKWIEGITAHLWQAAWYIALFGEPESIGGRTNVTKKGNKPNVQMWWRREVLDRIIAAEGEELKSLLGRVVKSWRELVDAIDWRWVLERVEQLVDELKPWIGPKKMDDAEREELVRRMLGELALIAHFAEARRGMDDGRWREERAKGLAKTVEVLSGGRISGEYADRLAKLIIRYAESRAEAVKKRIENLAGEVGVSREEVWGIVNRISSGDDPYVYCLAKDCAGDRIVRKFVAPALELIVLEKALDMMSKSKDEELKERIRKETLLWFGEMYATAIAGDGSVRRRSVELAIGGELGGGATLLRLAPLHLINQLLPNELKFGMRVYVKSGVYRIDAYGENAARFMRLLADSAPLAGGGHLSPKFKKLVEETQVKVEKPEEGLTLTEDWQRFTVLKYDNKGRFVIRFSSIKSGSIAQVKQKLERMGLKEGHHFTVTWPKEDRDGYAPNPNSIQQETQRLGEMGLEEGRHFSAKTPKGGGTGYVYILREGLAYAAWLSAHGEGEQKELAKSFVAHILKRAEDAGDNVYNKVLKIVEEGKKWDSLSLTDIRGAEVEVKNRKLGAEGEKYVVTVTGGGAKIEEKLLRLTITAEVNGVRGEYTITYVRRGRNNVAVAYAYASVADARRLAAVVKALTGEEPGVYQRSDGTMMIQCTKKHLEGFRRYKELAGAIEEWLEKTRR